MRAQLPGRRSRKAPRCSLPSSSLRAAIAARVRITDHQENDSIAPKHAPDLAEHGHQLRHVGVGRGLQADLAGASFICPELPVRGTSCHHLHRLVTERQPARVTLGQ